MDKEKKKKILKSTYTEIKFTFQYFCTFGAVEKSCRCNFCFQRDGGGRNEKLCAEQRQYNMKMFPFNKEERQKKSLYISGSIDRKHNIILTNIRRGRGRRLAKIMLQNQ